MTCAHIDCDLKPWRRGLCNAHYRGRTPTRRDTARRRAERVEDALWLLDNGEHPIHVRARLGWPTVQAMARAFRREGQPLPPVLVREQSLEYASNARKAAA